MSVTTVTFNDVESFLLELEQDVDKIDRRVVRCVFEVEQRNVHRHVYVVATVVVNGAIVQLREFVGEHWGPRFEEITSATEGRGDKISTAVREFCDKHELFLRSGVYK